MIVNEFTDFWRDFERYFGKRRLDDKCRIFLDGCREYRRSLTPCPMYGLLRFDRLSRDERAKYVTLGSLLKFARRGKDPVKEDAIFDKCSFHRMFADFTGRGVLDLRTADREVFAVFAKKARRVCVKPMRGTCGRGCSLVDCATESERFHDRYFIIDRKTLVHIGASLNYFGKKCFACSTFDPIDIPEMLAKLQM